MYAPIALVSKTHTTYIVPRRARRNANGVLTTTFDVYEGTKATKSVNEGERDAMIGAALQSREVGYRMLDRTKRGAKTSDYPAPGYNFDEKFGVFVAAGYVAEKCNGDAHSNPHIDNCGCCMPHWGFVIRASK